MGPLFHFWNELFDVTENVSVRETVPSVAHEDEEILSKSYSINDLK